MSPRFGRRRDESGLLGDLARSADVLRTAQDSDETRALMCREAASFAGASGAVLYLAEPGRLLARAGVGAHPRPPRGELDVDPRIERSVRETRLHRDADLVVVPVLGEGGTLGALALYGVNAPDDAIGSALRVFGHLAGGVFERFGSKVEAGDEDPVTGVGDHRRGAAALASIRAGDGVAVCELDGIRATRQQEVARADLAMGRLGLHLRNAIRPGDAVARSGEEAMVVVLRQLRAPIDVVVQRVLGAWSTGVAGSTVSVGAALHLDPHSPADTVEAAQHMLEAAQGSGTGRLYVAPV